MSLRTQLLALRFSSPTPELAEPIFSGEQDQNGDWHYPELDTVIKVLSNHLLDAATEYRDEAGQLLKSTHRVIPLEIAAALERLARRVLDKPLTDSALTGAVLDREARDRATSEIPLGFEL